MKKKHSKQEVQWKSPKTKDKKKDSVKTRPSTRRQERH